MKIAVIGLGYVGLPLSLQFARSCVSVLGLDADPKKVELLNDGQSYIKHIQSAEIAELVAAGKFYASTDFGQIKEVEAVIICVPTPLKGARSLLRFADRPVNCPTPTARDAGGTRVHDLSRNHRGRPARCSRRKLLS